jgi:hypothetical protein
MSLMGISEFAELSWLSQRALRLYDELRLLPPPGLTRVRGTAGTRPRSWNRRAWLRRCASWTFRSRRLR